MNIVLISKTDNTGTTTHNEKEFKFPQDAGEHAQRAMKALLAEGFMLTLANANGYELEHPDAYAVITVEYNV